MLKTVPVVIVFSLFIAVILNQKFRGRMFARAIFFMPVVVTSGIVISIVNGDAFINSVEADASSSIFDAAGMEKILEGMMLPDSIIDFFTQVINQTFDTLWKCGVQILLFLAALQGVPPQLYEAAKIEGATGWESFWKVTFPMITPMILVNAVYRIIDSFTTESNVVMTFISKKYSSSNGQVISSAMSWIYFLIVIIIVSVIAAIISAFVFYQRKAE